MASSAITNAGTMFPRELVSQMFSNVKGHSSLARLSGQDPIPFGGQDVFVFSLDGEAEIVGESGEKSGQNAEIKPVTIRPIKFVYQHRVSDEFMHCAQERRLNYMKEFSAGFAAKMARGFDLAAIHGVNPKTGSASTIVGTNHFDSQVTQIVTESTSATADANVEAAIALIQGSEYDVTGMAMTNEFRSKLAAMTTSGGAKMYPELGWGRHPGTINGLTVDVNSTVKASTKDLALLGDFSRAFRWGYALNVPFKVIEYGDPDNTGKDLQGYNQVLLRAEAYIGWGILDASAFAFVKSA